VFGSEGLVPITSLRVDQDILQRKKRRSQRVQQQKRLDMIKSAGKQYTQGSENIPVEKSSAPRFETWNGSRDPSETNLAWVDFLNIGQFCAIDHALF